MENERNRQTIVCFAGCDWWYHNRGLFCPQVMTRLARKYKVLFVNSLGMRVPSLGKDSKPFKKVIRKLKSIGRFICRVEAGMYVFSPLSLPFLGNTLGRKLNTFLVWAQVKLVMTFLGFRNPVFYIGCPPALKVVRKLGKGYLIYERTDLFGEMPGVDKSYITSLDQELTRSANLVLCVNKAVWQQSLFANQNSLLLGHGVDFERFANAEETNHIPRDIAAITKPIVGFFGDITEDVCDFSLLERTANNLHDVSIVLIGPISSDVKKLRRHNNIFFLGQKPYEEIPHYGKSFDVAIMPWKRNRWIEFCNPVKTKEYLALGKPIVSTDYPELKPYHDIVYPASNDEEFVAGIRRALEEDSDELKRKRQERVRNETWDSKTQQIINFIENDLRRKNVTD
ncbi:MAG: glycosyltransferase [Sedimentisphaerales bacterium]